MDLVVNHREARGAFRIAIGISFLFFRIVFSPYCTTEMVSLIGGMSKLPTGVTSAVNSTVCTSGVPPPRIKIPDRGKQAGGVEGQLNLGQFHRSVGGDFDHRPAGLGGSQDAVFFHHPHRGMLDGHPLGNRVMGRGAENHRAPVEIDVRAGLDLDAVGQVLVLFDLSHRRDARHDAPNLQNQFWRKLHIGKGGECSRAPVQDWRKRAQNGRQRQKLAYLDQDWLSY